MKKTMYLFLSLLVMVFIFGNSMMDAVDSNSESGFITSLAQRFLLLLGFQMPPAELHHLIRKCAHFTEFALESFFIAKTFAVFKVCRRTWLPYALLIGLLTAVVDENIQLHSIGRSGQVSDIFLDFSGTVAGVAMAVFSAYKRR
ncbi:MAG: VanZ family protein [Acidaminococcaceae bacterium]